jgi:hypothetical protein
LDEPSCQRARLHQPLGQVSKHLGNQLIKAVAISLSICLVAVLGLSLSAAALAGDQVSKPEQSDQQRPIGDLRKDVKAFVKRSKSKEDPVASVGAIIDLCHLHTEIVNDPRFKTNDQLKSFRAIAATRLKNYAKEIELEIKRRNRRSASESRQSQKLVRDSAQAPLGNTSPTAGQNKEADPTWNHGDDKALFNKEQPGIDHGSVLTDAMERDIYAMSKFTGGPVQVWSHVGGNFAPPWDHGPELVALIESTIDPQSWKTNGGDGVIHYYRPLRILVVTASSSVQDDLTNMLRNLRRLSR